MIPTVQARGFKGLTNEHFDNARKEKGRKLKELSGPRGLPITGKHVKSGWPTGYLYPIVGSLRPALDYSGDAANWRVANPMKVFDGVKVQVAKTPFAGCLRHQCSRP